MTGSVHLCYYFEGILLDADADLALALTSLHGISPWTYCPDDCSQLIGAEVHCRGASRPLPPRLNNWYERATPNIPHQPIITPILQTAQVALKQQVVAHSVTNANAKRTTTILARLFFHSKDAVIVFVAPSPRPPVIIVAVLHPHVAIATELTTKVAFWSLTREAVEKGRLS